MTAEVALVGCTPQQAGCRLQPAFVAMQFVCWQLAFAVCCWKPQFAVC
jgi:hypothetical protein